MRHRAGLALVSAGLGALAMSGTASAQGAKPEVTIKDLAFGPAALTVRAGTVVQFENADPEAHSVVASDGSFNSHEIAPGKSVAITFSKPGTIRYFCGVHPFMEGQVVVKP